jgi:hypothetical protein
MQPTKLASKTFSVADQQRFAEVSGDYNPMHLDAVLARRTPPGAPVVHGVHLLLWALDSLAVAHPELPPMRSLRTRFNRFVYVGETPEAFVMERGPDSASLNVSVAGTPMSQITVEFGDSKLDSSDLSAFPPELTPRSRCAMDWSSAACCARGQHSVGWHDLSRPAFYLCRTFG